MKYSFKTIGIRGQILISVILFTVLIFLLVMLYLSVNVKHLAIDDSKKVVEGYTQRYAKEIQGIFNGVMDITRTLADVFVENEEIYQRDADPLNNQILINTLNNNEDFWRCGYNGNLMRLIPTIQKSMVELVIHTLKLTGIILMMQLFRIHLTTL